VLELGKIPALMDHFQEHKAQRSQLSFDEFLFMHYVGDDANDQDNNSDEQLPFKNTNDYSGVSIDGIWLPDNSMVFTSSVELVLQNTIPIYKADLLKQFNDPLFRPPVLG
jgi:hypothetical protein